MKRSWPVLALAAAIALIGCAGQKRVETRKPDPPGTLRSIDGSVSIVMPAGWIAIDPHAGNAEKFSQQLGKKNSQINDYADRSAGALLQAMSASEAQAKAAVKDTLSINSAPSGGKTAFTDREIQQYKRQYAAQMHPKGDVEMAPVKLDVGSGLRYSARLSIVLPNGKTVETVNIGYLIFHGDESYVVTFTTAPERAKSMKKIAERAMKTLSFGPANR